MKARHAQRATKARAHTKKKVKKVPSRSARVPRGFETYSQAELRILRSLSTPQRIQSFLDRIKYNTELHGETSRSPRGVLAHREAHCMEGALFAAAAMRFHGKTAYLVDLEAEGDYDHVLCVFRERGLWGALSKSHFHSLGYRDPIYRSIRELALSYFPWYNNYRGQKTLRRYSLPVRLSQFDKLKWTSTTGSVWAVTTTVRN